jgi:hypothetical protein
MGCAGRFSAGAGYRVVALGNKGIIPKRDPGHVPTPPPSPDRVRARPVLPQAPAAPFFKTQDNPYLWGFQEEPQPALYSAVWNFFIAHC